jgi:hypothetical protein
LFEFDYGFGNIVKGELGKGNLIVDWIW